MRFTIEQITRSQISSFEKAHTRPSELKHISYNFPQGGPFFDRPYSDLGFILPGGIHNQIDSNLSPQEKSLFSALYFINFYSHVASNEELSLKFNLQVAELCFEKYSDEYMVLFNETYEEMDHITCFRKIFKTIIGLPFNGIPSQFDGACKEVFFKRTFFFDPLLSAKSGLCSNGFGALYLLLRYIGNVHLKKYENFLFDGRKSDSYHSSAFEITSSHRHDEARHFRTSLGLGMSLFNLSNGPSQRKIRLLLSIIISDYINNSFMNKASEKFSNFAYLLEAQDLYQRYYGQPGHPSLLGIEENLSSVKGHLFDSQQFHSSQTWAAKALKQLIDHLDLKVAQTGEGVSNYMNHLRVTI